ncbi:MAG: Dihydroorotate dehydrogenase, electron transfer subunit, iron-sulfur cluster binding domain protein [Conexibacter sp.]|nr:Dihydroorotate dehydrogenase, electron transfer subunit, iron-sulfur cluster binding domain protein [Conexibacter sp.]
MSAGALAVTTDDGRRTLAPPGRRRVTVLARQQFGAYAVLRCADPGGPPPRPGQFAMLATAERWGGGDGERPFLPRAFSVLRARPGELEFLLEDVGPGTARLAELEPGDGLWVLGPLGIGFSVAASELAGRRALLVGGGVGIAPLAILQDELVASDAAVTALLGFRDGLHAAGAALLRDARIATDDGSAGHAGLVTDLLTAELDRDQAAIVYACGPPPMLEAVRALCAGRAVPAQLALESGMACGFGACFGCVVPTRSGYVRLCLDGPVLDADRLETALTPGAGH